MPSGQRSVAERGPRATPDLLPALVGEQKMVLEATRLTMRPSLKMLAVPVNRTPKDRLK
jgi:hypothetical protein